MAERAMKIDKEKTAGYTRHSVEVDGKKRRVIDNNDEVANMLRGKTTDEELRAIAVEHGLSDRWDGWSHLNAGQKRMNLGNSLRAKFRKAREAEAAKAAA